MKRYSKTVIDGRYSEMTEDDLGDWVPAEVAQALYDALIDAINMLELYGIDSYVVDQGNKAISLAGGEE